MMKKGQALLSDVGNDGRSIDTPRFLFRVVLAGIHTQVLILHGVILIMSIYLAASFLRGLSGTNKTKQHGDS